jgi:hypothetical protein
MELRGKPNAYEYAMGCIGERLDTWLAEDTRDGWRLFETLISDGIRNVPKIADNIARLKVAGQIIDLGYQVGLQPAECDVLYRDYAAALSNSPPTLDQWVQEVGQP